MLFEIMPTCSTHWFHLNMCFWMELTNPLYLDNWDHTAGAIFPACPLQTHHEHDATRQHQTRQRLCY